MGPKRDSHKNEDERDEARGNWAPEERAIHTAEPRRDSTGKRPKRNSEGGEAGVRPKKNSVKPIIDTDITGVQHIHLDQLDAQNSKPRLLSIPDGADIHDKVLQRQLEAKEKELQKKLEYHKQDLADADDSDQSICIAKPPPSNRMSVVKLISCGLRGYKITLLVCAALLFLAAMVQCLVLFLVVTLWPMGFADQFEVRIPGIPKHILVICVAVTPLVSLIWLLASILCARRSRICWIDNDTFCCIRGYYAYSAFLLVIPLMAFIVYVLYVGRLDPEILESIMKNSLNNYDAIPESKANWDDAQSYFQCCGVDQDGWRNWESRDKVNEAVPEWKVPVSCCRIENKTLCSYETIDDFVWNEGCLQKVFSVYTMYGHFVVFALLGSMIISCYSIYFSTRYYAILRAREEPGFEFHVFTYIVECGSCCRHCRPVINII